MGKIVLKVDKRPIITHIHVQVTSSTISEQLIFWI